MSAPTGPVHAADIPPAAEPASGSTTPASGGATPAPRVPAWLRVVLAVVALVGAVFLPSIVTMPLAAVPAIVTAVNDEEAPLFGVLHLASNGGQVDLVERIVYLSTPTAFGFAAAALVLCTRSLWPAVGIHAGFHLSTLAATLLTGREATGPAVWLIAAAVYTAVGGVALAWWLRRPRALRGPVVLDR